MSSVSGVAGRRGQGHRRTRGGDGSRFVRSFDSKKARRKYVKVKRPEKLVCMILESKFPVISWS
jgi:hypothetical protein